MRDDLKKVSIFINEEEKRNRPEEQVMCGFRERTMEDVILIADELESEIKYNYCIDTINSPTDRDEIEKVHHLLDKINSKYGEDYFNILDPDELNKKFIQLSTLNWVIGDAWDSDDFILKEVRMLNAAMEKFREVKLYDVSKF